jgi:hypothetical protein
VSQGPSVPQGHAENRVPQDLQDLEEKSGLAEKRVPQGLQGHKVSAGHQAQATRHNAGCLCLLGAQTAASFDLVLGGVRHAGGLLIEVEP